MIYCVSIPTICWDGALVPCAALSYRRDYFFFHRRRTYPRLVFGNVLDTGLAELLTGGEPAGFKSAVESGDYPWQCRYCLRNYGLICG